MSRRFVAKLLVVLSGLLAVPAATAHAARPEPVRPGADCAAVADQLTSTAGSVQAALAAVPPDTAGARELLGDLLGIVAEAQRNGCLPAIPPEGDATACDDALADLLAQAYAAVAALVSTGVPDVPAALEQATKLVATVATVVDVCLPAAPPTATR